MVPQAEEAETRTQRSTTRSTHPAVRERRVGGPRSRSSPSIRDRNDRISATVGVRGRGGRESGGGIDGGEDISSLQRASITSRAFLNGLRPTPRFADGTRHKSPDLLPLLRGAFVSKPWSAQPSISSAAALFRYFRIQERKRERTALFRSRTLRSYLLQALISAHRERNDPGRVGRMERTLGGSSPLYAGAAL